MNGIVFFTLSLNMEIVSYIVLYYHDQIIRMEYTRFPYDEESMFYQERETVYVKDGRRQGSSSSTDMIKELIEYIEYKTERIIRFWKDIEYLSLEYEIE